MSMVGRGHYGHHVVACMFCPTPGRVGHYRYAQVREMFRRADARKHEELRAVVSAGGEDDFMLAAFLSNNAALKQSGHRLHGYRRR